jgi:hypothetical protein
LKKLRIIVGCSGVLIQHLFLLSQRKKKLELFDDSKPISLCNYIYKIMAKVIAIKVKGVLSKAISLE